jgi:CHAT domain-containing protein
MSRSARFAELLVNVFCSILLCLFAPTVAAPQETSQSSSGQPAEFEAVDPEIRILLDEARAVCGPFDVNDRIERAQKALQIADSRGLINDRALARAILASAYIGQGEIELAFTTFRDALQDAIDSKNQVLEADILISLAAEAQVKGNILQSIDLISRAENISEKTASFYEKARALGDLGKMKLLLGKTDEAAISIDEALRIDKLNGYRFEALHLVYRGYYLGLAGKVDQAIDSLIQARTKAVTSKDPYSFIMAENAYAFGLVKKGRPDEAIVELSLLQQGNVQKFVHSDLENACLGPALASPMLHLTLLEGLTNVYEATNQKEKELEIWQDAYSFSGGHGILAGEAEAAHKVADLDNQLKKTDDALKYYAVAADLYRRLQNEPLLAQVEISQSQLLMQAGRGKEALLLQQEVASYAKRHGLRGQEFLAYGVLAETYQPDGELEHARDALEKALSLVRPGPFDDELDNRFVLEDYLRLGDVYRALKIPTRELVAIDKAFVVAVHLKDEKVQQNLVAYLDQRLKDLGIRELVIQRQKEGHFAESLLYACVLYMRDGDPKPGEDNSNWNRILTLPFQMAQGPEGAKALTEVLDEVDSFLGSPKVAMIDALSRYYIIFANDPVLAEKYALRSEEIVNGFTGNVTPLKAETACVLAIAYSREFKTVLAKSKLIECSKFANEANDGQSLAFAAAANALVHTGTGDPASATETLEHLLAKVPDNPELHVELAMSLANSKFYEKAASQLELAVSKLTSEGDKKTAAGDYVRVAIVLSSDNSPKAQELQLQYLKFGQRIYHDLNAQAEEAGTLNALGEYYIKVSDVKAAIEQINKAYDLALRANRADLAAQAMSDLGNAYQAQKHFSEARDFHKKAAAAYHELRNPGLEAFCLQNLARDYAALNETDERLTALLEAKRAAASAPALSQYFANVFLGGFYREQGQFEKSLAIYHELIGITEQSGDVEHSAYTHLAIAELDGLIGGWEDAESESKVALGLFAQLGSKDGQAASWAVLTGIYSDRTSSLKDFDKARECYAKAQEFGYGENLQLDLMEVYLQNGNYAEGEKIASASIRRCVKDADPDCQAHGLLSLSEIERLRGDIRAARTSLNQARPLASKSQEIYLHGRLLYTEARQLASERKLDEALASYKELIALIEGVKGKLDAREQRSLSENYDYIYDELVSLLYSMSKRDSQAQLKFASESLEYAEVNKARQFAESWGRTFVNQMQRLLPASVQEAERSLFSRRDRILGDLSVSAASGETLTKHQKESSEAELVAAQKDIASFLQKLRTKSPQYAAVAYPEAIQVSVLPLRKDETFVEFKMTDDSTFVWIVQNQSGTGNEIASFYRIPLPRSWFRDRVSLLRNALNSRHPEAADWKISEELFSALFPGEASRIVEESHELIFVPDDVLFTLPFEVFSPTASKRDFVFLSKPTTYYPSAVSFRLARAATHEANWQEGFLGIADPITSREDERFEDAQATSFTRVQSSQSASPTGDDKLASTPNQDRMKARGFSFERLPGTAVEVQDIAALLRKANEKVELRIGIDATKNELLDTDLSKFRFLHFATHGVLPVDTDVSEPALVLSVDGISPSHMFLSLSEILRLKLRAESVVLSACNTGSGTISRAEGVMSLGRAFLAAGSSSVTVSLWQVSDESTAALMEQYYRGLLAGKKKNVALAEARQTLFASSYKDPFYWAPFILIGE